MDILMLGFLLTSNFGCTCFYWYWNVMLFYDLFMTMYYTGIVHHIALYTTLVH